MGSWKGDNIKKTIVNTNAEETSPGHPMLIKKTSSTLRPKQAQIGMDTPRS